VIGGLAGQAKIVGAVNDNVVVRSEKLQGLFHIIDID
jgi:hypothetical protein